MIVVLKVIGTILFCAAVIIFGLAGCALALTDKTKDDSSEDNDKQSK